MGDSALSSAAFNSLEQKRTISMNEYNTAKPQFMIQKTNMGKLLENSISLMIQMGKSKAVHLCQMWRSMTKTLVTCGIQTLVG
jgi:hypothetical protein